jgi:hypothetical protein
VIVALDVLRGARASIMAAAIASALALLGLACGYSTGLRAAERHRTIGVEFFGNDTYERDLERPFYDEVSRVLRDTSDAPLVDPRKADVVLRGTITEFRRRRGIRSAENRLLETGVYIEVQAELVDRLRDLPLRGPVRQGVWVGFQIGPAENEREARQRALHNVAEEVVLDLFAPVN